MKINIKEKFQNVVFVQYVVLFIVIVSLFVFADFDFLNKNVATLYVINTINNTKLEISNNIYMKDNEIYLSIEDINNNFNNSVYLDKMSRTIILTTEDEVVQFELNSTKASVNYKVNDMKTEVYIKHNNIDYINLHVLSNLYGFVVFVDSDNNVCISKEVLEGSFNKQYINFNSICENYVRHLNSTAWNVKVVLDKLYYTKTENYYTVIMYNDEASFIGKVLKKYIDVDIIQKEEDTKVVDNKFNSVIVNNTDTALDKNVEINAINLIKLSSAEGKISVVDFANTIDNVYAIYTNGYASPTYDNAITSILVQNLVNRNKNIQNIIEYVEKSGLTGVILDFRNLKVRDKVYFEQYIKELSAALHSMNKKLMVYVRQDADYVSVRGIIPYVDNVIYVTYLNVSSMPRMAYSLTNIRDIEQSLNSLQYVINEYMFKILLEIPLYSVLWMEKNSVVTGYELYSLNAVQSFLKENDIAYYIDKTTGLNYAEFNRGNLKYKIWIEDENSIKQKYRLAQKYMLGGIVIYKKGYESNWLYDILKGDSL